MTTQVKMTLMTIMEKIINNLKQIYELQFKNQRGF